MPPIDVVSAALTRLRLKDDNEGDAVLGYLAETDDSEDGLLKLWQALCLEFGLVQNPDDPAVDPKLPPLPLSKTKAKELLKTRAHVSIVDYLIARDTLKITCVPWGHFADLLHPSAGALATYIRKSAKSENRRRYRVRRRMRRRGASEEKITEVVISGSKIFPRELAKSEGLQPLLREVFQWRK
ncbi:hypothetical protein CspHIS471_0304620 [Cutaneotrichosporon sp. HIS471]|nr:hypothetical protein CspHIS471_0304620 [Cutaneotrichosporon sp. HIS471]